MTQKLGMQPLNPVVDKSLEHLLPVINQSGETQPRSLSPSKDTIDVKTGLNWWPSQQSLNVNGQRVDVYVRSEGAENKFAIRSPSNPNEYLTLGSQSKVSGITLSANAKQQIEIAAKSNYPSNINGGSSLPINGNNAPYKTAGLTNPFSTKINLASDGRSQEQIYKDFFALEKTPDKYKAGLGTTKVFWGTFTGEPNTTPLTNSVEPGTFMKEQGSLPLPNLKDNIPSECGLGPEELRDSRNAALRTLSAGRFVLPMSARSIQHYLTGLGKPLETTITKKLFNNTFNESAGYFKLDKYTENLEQSALRYAQNNPNVKEFTVQGPLVALESSESDVKTSLGQFWAGGRAHYVATRGDNGKILLVGNTQLIAVDYYNFKVFGQHMPLMPGEKQSSIPQGVFLGMTACKIPNTNTNMAYPYAAYGKQKIQFSRISNY
jgi:hypothetical protein